MGALLQYVAGTFYETMVGVLEMRLCRGEKCRCQAIYRSSNRWDGRPGHELGMNRRALGKHLGLPFWRLGLIRV